MRRLTRLARRFKSPFQGHEIREGGSDAARRAGRRTGAISPHCPNDNHGSKAGTGGGPDVRIEDAVMRLARLLGHQIAREQFARPDAANDNAPEKEAHEE